MAQLKNGTLKNGTDIMVHYITVHYTTVCRTNLTLDMVSHNQQNSLTHGLVGQDQSQSTELNQPMDWLGVQPTEPTLTLDMVSHSQQNSTNPWIGWAFSLT